MTKAGKLLSLFEYKMEPSYKGLKLVRKGLVLQALNDDGFTKYEVAIGSGGYTKEDVDKLKQKIDAKAQ